MENKKSELPKVILVLDDFSDKKDLISRSKVREKELTFCVFKNDYYDHSKNLKKLIEEASVKLDLEGCRSEDILLISPKGDSYINLSLKGDISRATNELKELFEIYTKRIGDYVRKIAKSYKLESDFSEDVETDKKTLLEGSAKAETSAKVGLEKSETKVGADFSVSGDVQKGSRGRSFFKTELIQEFSRKEKESVNIDLGAVEILRAKASKDEVLRMFDDMIVISTFDAWRDGGEKCVYAKKSTFYKDYDRQLESALELSSKLSAGVKMGSASTEGSASADIKGKFQRELKGYISREQNLVLRVEF